MLRLLSFKAQENKPKPYQSGIHWIALAEYSLMSTHVPRFQLISLGFLPHFVLVKLATTNIRVK